jgi:hypothetical protein
MKFVSGKSISISKPTNEIAKPMKDKDLDKCGCICHKEKPISEHSNGLVHDILCCDKMNGSLMVYGVNEIIKSKQQEAYNEGVKHTVKSIYRQLVDGKESISVTFKGGEAETSFNLKK